jgi:histidinol-phosphate aminotransferase
MAADAVRDDPPEIELPLNLGLNDGTFAPAAVVERMKQLASRTALRNYTSPENDELRELIARQDGVGADQVFLHNGSGPILKLCIPYIVEQSIRASPLRIARHLISKTGFPLVTPRFTYSKVPKKGHAVGLRLEFIPLSPDTGFQLDPAEIEAALHKRDSMVYITSPNNPTGNVLITREQLIPLLEKFPRSEFWIDEAYVHYADPAQHEPVSSLVSRFPNLSVSRTFSFAYGMAGLRVGYLLTSAERVKAFWGKLTDYRIGSLQQELAMAALQDEEHLPFVRAETAKQRAIIREALAPIDAVETYDSTTNFVFCRFTDGRDGAWLKEQLGERGIKIKTLEPFADLRYDPFFRLTIGLEHETRFLMEQIVDILR